MNIGRITECKELQNLTGVFEDRVDAGRMLARLVMKEALYAPLVLAIPAGGVPVAVALAEAMACPLEIAVVSKITLPWNSEVGYGAVAFDGSYQLNEDLVRSLGMSENMVTSGVDATRAKVARRVSTLRGDRPLPDLATHDLIVVDDGLASGFTMLVAITALKRSGARSIIVAVPTGQAETVQRIALHVTAVCCANLRTGYPFAVASAYRNWSDISEAEALLTLLDVDRKQGN